MPFIYRPNGDTDYSNAVIVDDPTLPHDVTGLAAGYYQVGRIGWDPDAVVVTGVSVDPPINTVLPYIYGIFKEGSTLTTSDGDWNKGPPEALVFSRQWYRDGVAIPGEDSETYLLKTADIGSTLSTRTTATFEGVTSAPAIALNTPVIEAADVVDPGDPSDPVAPTVITAPTIAPASGDVGTVFTLSEGTYGGTTPITLTGTLMLGGVDVTAQISGGVYTSTAEGALSWSVEASNTAGSTTNAASATVTEAAGVMPITALSADGWKATYPSPPAEFDPVTTPEIFTVTRQGYDATGAATTVTETITINKRVREPYPNGTTLTTDDVALSDFIYSGDTVLGVTNNSALDYPLPISMWLRPDMDIAEGGSYTARVAVAHKFGRNYKPVAAVKFLISDGTTTLEQTVTGMSLINYATSGLSVPHFSCTFDTSGFADGAVLTLDAVIYPWVGAAYDTAVDGAAGHSINFGTTRVYNSISGPPAYAAVSTTGDDGTGAASSVLATAQALPFATISAAAAAVETLNGGTASGCLIHMEDGVHKIANFSGRDTTTGPIILRGESRSGSSIECVSDTQSAAYYLPSKIAFQNMTLDATLGRPLLDISGASNIADTVLQIEDVDYITGTYAQHMYKVGRVWLINSEFVGGAGGLKGQNAPKMANVIGCKNISGDTVYNVTGSISPFYSDAYHSNSSLQASAGLFLGFNFFTNNSASTPQVRFFASTGPTGVAFVANVVEDQDGGSAPGAQFWADGGIQPVENLLIHFNTLVGERTNLPYQGTGDAFVRKLVSIRGNVFKSCNFKSDYFAASSNNTGNWAVRYRVGCAYNAVLEGADDSTSTPSISSWLGERFGVGESSGSTGTPIAPDWVNDGSSTGTGAGMGDYTPGASTELTTIPDGFAPHPYDLFGNAFSSGAFIGAVQRAA